MKKAFVLAGLLVWGGVAGSQAQQAGRWVGTWACAPIELPKSDKTPYANTTIRDVVHVSVGGPRVRLKISNEYGATPLTLAETHLALSAGGGKAVAGSDHAVLFGGQASVTIPAGALAVSDPVAMPVAALSDLAVSFYVPEGTLPVLTYHALGSSSTYHSGGNHAAEVELPGATKAESWMLLTGVDVDDSGTNASAVATLGDSITDGAHSTPDRNRRWPDVLAARLQGRTSTNGVGVLNEGVSGGRILHDHAGINALARLDRDVLAQSGVKYLVVMESINDIRYATNPRGPEDVVTSQQLIWGLTQIVQRAHARGIKVYGATLTPYGGSRNSKPEGEAMRAQINEWIRTSGTFDAVLDFDKVTRDPARPEQFWPSNDSGDHLHPSDAGYKAMADSVDLKLFE
jgi:lysophospholipase L1-like esterase